VIFVVAESKSRFWNVAAKAEGHARPKAQTIANQVFMIAVVIFSTFAQLDQVSCPVSV